MKNQLQLAILTATYNRAYTLPKLYESLIAQKNQSFVWVVVDDGSEDETEELVRNWMDIGLIRIHYYRKINGGKHTALNLGVSKIKENYIFVVDSDDYLLENAVDNILRWISEIDKNREFAGVSGLKGEYVNGSMKPLGQFPERKTYIDATNLERRKRKLMGDKAEVYRTELLRRFPFSEYAGEKFIPEDVVFHKIALEGLKIRWHNEVITICEYLSDGLTAAVGQEHFEKNYKGYCESYYLNWIGLPFPYNHSSAVEFYRKAKKMGKNRKDICDVLRIGYFQYVMLFLAFGVKKMIKK